MLDYMERAGAIARFFLPCGNTVRRKNIIEKSARNPAYLGRLPAGAAVARVNSGLRGRGCWNTLFIRVSEVGGWKRPVYAHFRGE